MLAGAFFMQLEQALLPHNYPRHGALATVSTRYRDGLASPPGRERVVLIAVAVKNSRHRQGIVAAGLSCLVCDTKPHFFRSTFTCSYLEFLRL